MREDRTLHTSVKNRRSGFSVSKSIAVSYRSVFLWSMLYLLVPLVIFLFAYTRLYWALLVSIILSVTGYFAYRSIDKDRAVEMTPALIICTAVISLLWVYLAGAGEFSWASHDHNVRAAILNDLVNYDWPVIYDLSTQSNPEVVKILGQGGQAAFSYYFFFWTVPALIGKLLGLTAARVSFLIWSAAGIFMSSMLLSFFQKKPQITAITVLFLFGGFDLIMFGFRTLIQHESATFEGWNRELYIHGDFFQTMNTINQAIPGWMITMLLLNHKDNRFIGFFGSLSFCYSPWVTIGLLPIAICELLREKSQISFKRILSPGNIISPVIVLLVFGTYFTSNPAATGVKGFLWEFFPGEIPAMIMAYILYVIFEFGIWVTAVLPDAKRDPVFITAVLTLLIMPVWKMTEMNDFVMRGTLAPMLVIMIYVLKRFDLSVERLRKNGNDLRSAGFMVLFLVSGMTAVVFLIISAVSTVKIYDGEDTSIQPYETIVSFGDIRSEEYTGLVQRQFFVYDFENRPFYKIFGKTGK